MANIEMHAHYLCCLLYYHYYYYCHTLLLWFMVTPWLSYTLAAAMLLRHE